MTQIALRIAEDRGKMSPIAWQNTNRPLEPKVSGKSLMKSASLAQPYSTGLSAKTRSMPTRSLFPFSSPPWERHFYIGWRLAPILS
jgi:hypothetical protein